MFIAIDGIDGCGKSTLTKNVVARLRDHGHTVLHTVEPYQREVRARISQGVDPFVALSLFVIDRDRHVNDIILPNRKNIVVTDRYMFSTAAYQGYLLRDLIPDAVNVIWQSNCALFPRPDRSYIIDIPVDIALERLRWRRKTDIYEHSDILTQVRKNFLYLARTDPTVCILDGTLPPDDLCNSVYADFKNRQKIA